MTIFRACAKTILAGEHTVIRGGPALVVPVYKCDLNVLFTPGAKCEIFFDGDIPVSAQSFFENVLDRALAQAGRARSDLLGSLRFRSSIPIGGGMGSSAALCVSVARVFQSLGWLAEPELFEFSRGLEDLFHGTSSGVDVAACLQNAPIRFQKVLGDDGVLSGVSWRPLQFGWQPNFFISYCGVSGKTSECVAQVRGLWEKDAAFARALDSQMSEAVTKIETAMADVSPAGGACLSDGLKLGASCFEQWGLITDPLRVHMIELTEAGAVAVKPTGSGGGGYVLSLWEPDVVALLPASLRDRMIAIPLRG